MTASLPKANESLIAGKADAKNTRIANDCQGDSSLANNPPAVRGALETPGQSRDNLAPSTMRLAGLASSFKGTHWGCALGRASTTDRCAEHM